jgi:cytochrome c-type biogenesis protein CcmH/NrfG
MPLVLELVEHDKWVPIYNDIISIVFIKNVPENRQFIEKYKVPKEDVYNAMMYRASLFSLSDKTNPRHLMALGNTFYKAGRLDDAIKAYEYALKRMPGSSAIKAKLDMLKSERAENKDVSKANTKSKPH